MSKEIIPYIDVLKGIGILLVVIAHVYAGKLGDILFIFHMPLFFFISGFLFTKKSNAKDYFNKKVRHLLVPYLAFLLLFNIPLIVSKLYYFFQTSSYAVLESLLVKLSVILYGGELLTGFTGILWFITVLFFTQQIFNQLVLKTKKESLVIILLVSYILSLLNYYFLPDVAFPLAINVVLAALPFFGAGYYFRNYFNKNSVKFNLVKIILVMFLLLGITLLVQYSVRINYNLKFSEYGVPILSFLAALGGISVCFYLARQIEKFSNLKQPLALLGSASLIVLYLHQFIQISMRESTTVLFNDPLLRTIVAIIIPLVLYFVIKKSRFLSALFLGK